MSREVWITGLGAVCGQGISLPEIWGRLTGGRPVSPAAPLRLAPHIGADVDPATALGHPAFSVPDGAYPDGFRHSARDTFVLALRAAREALAGAGLAEGGAADCGVILGSTAGNALHFLEEYRALRGGCGGSGSGFADFFAYSPAAALSRGLRFSGPALTVGNACCSGADAIGLAWEWIRGGRCRRILAGGADALSFIPYTGFRRLLIYSPEPCRPFDRQRRGLNLGEGAGVLLLESAEAAAERGAAPLARVLGYGAASDAHHLTAPHPEGRGLARAVGEALRHSGPSADAIDFVNVHGTATPDNDRVEGLVLKKLLPGARIWASKGATGHTLGASGGLEAVFTAMALHRRTLPGSPGFATADPEIGVSPRADAENFAARAALSTSLGFGGGASALVLGVV